MRCFHCRSSDLRLSHIHLYDVPKILRLKIPVRCRSCHERFYVSLNLALRIGFLAKGARKRHGQDRNTSGGSATA